MFRNYINQLNPEFKDNFWIDRFIFEFSKKTNESNVVISDIRFQNELDAVTKVGGIIIKINGRIQDNDYSTHVSESGIDNLTGIMYTLDNIGSFDELHQKIDEILSNLKMIC